MLFAPVDRRVILETFQTYVKAERAESEELFAAIDSYTDNAPLKVKILVSPIVQMLRLYALKRGELSSIAEKLLAITLNDERNSDEHENE